VVRTYFQTVHRCLLNLAMPVSCRFSDENVCISNSPHAAHMSRPGHPSRFTQSEDISIRLHIVQLYIMFSPSSSYWTLSFSPQRFVSIHRKPVFFFPPKTSVSLPLYHGGTTKIIFMYPEEFLPRKLLRTGGG